MREQSDNLTLAIGVIIFTVFALSLGDALVKFFSGDFVLWQIFVLRSLLVLPVLALCLWRWAPEAMGLPPALGWTALRSLMLVSMWVAYYAALLFLELSIAAAAFYASPIFITLFSAVLIGDRVRPLGWLAVLIGFLGVLLILRPRAGDFNVFAMLPLLSAVLYALSMILTRTKCRDVHPIMLSVALNVAFVVVGAAVALVIYAAGPGEGFLLAPWSKIGGAEWATMALLGLSILIGSLGAAIAYQKGPPAIIGVFDFAYVGFAVLWGLVFFAEVPDTVSWVGIVMIVAAGIMSLRK